MPRGGRFHGLRLTPPDSPALNHRTMGRCGIVLPIRRIAAAVLSRARLTAAVIAVAAAAAGVVCGAVSAGAAIEHVGAPAPDFSCARCLNHAPFKLSDLRGKVVLVDFWEYTCINCIRTFPYLRRWDQLYGPEGLIILGVHTPEFAFAKNPQNVANAIKRFGFTFPVVLDNDETIWSAFHNLAWPADFLIDKDGRLAYSHIGEGDYGDTELAIRKLLTEANPGLNFSTARFALPADANANMDSVVCRRATPE